MAKRKTAKSSSRKAAKRGKRTLKPVGTVDHPILLFKDAADRARHDMEDLIGGDDIRRSLIKHGWAALNGLSTRHLAEVVPVMMKYCGASESRVPSPPEGA